MIRRISVILAAMIVGRGMGVVGLRVSVSWGGGFSWIWMLLGRELQVDVYMYGEVKFSSIRESTLSSGYGEV